MTETDKRAYLARLYEAYQPVRFPKVPFEPQELTNFDVEMAEEDGYLAGIVSTFLETNRMNVSEIKINRSIDERIEKCKGVVDSSVLGPVVTYRSMMMSLASALEEATRAPIVVRDTHDS